MKTGFIEWGIGSTSVPEKVKTVAGMGFDCISLHPFFPSMEEQEKTRIAVKEFNLGITFHCANESPETITQRINSYIDVVSDFQKHTNRVYCFSFDTWYPGIEKDGLNLDTMSAGIVKALSALSPMGVRVAVENSHFFTLRENFEALAEKVGRKDFGILLDIGHLNLKGDRRNKSVEECICSLPLEIYELHIHDNDGEKDLHQPLGMGNLDLKTIVKALKRREFDGVATLEIGSSNITGDEWIETIKRTRDVFMREWEQSK